MTEREKLRDKVHWAITLLSSVLGSCNRLLISASAEKNKRIAGLSYNGSLPGQSHCDEAGHLMISGHCERTRHAEMNLKDNTDQEKLRGSHVRVPGTPCLKCLKDLAGVPVASVELFQEIFDKLSGSGGMFNRLGYRVRLVKEPLEKK